MCLASNMYRRGIVGKHRQERIRDKSKCPPSESMSPASRGLPSRASEGYMLLTLKHYNAFKKVSSLNFELAWSCELPVFSKNEP